MHQQRQRSSTLYHRVLAVCAVMACLLWSLPQTASAQDCGWGYYIHVEQPYVGTEVIRGDAIDITWYADYIYWYGNVTTVSLEYSEDGGQSWNLIADGIPTDQNYYQWQTPTTLTPGTDYYIRISEAPNPYYFYCAPNSPGTVGPFTVLKGCFPPVFFQHPASASVCTGQAVTFTVETDANRPTYRWFKDGTLMTTTTVNSYTINPVSAGSAGSYTVEVIDACGALALSNPAALTVRIAPAITQNPPATISVCENASVTMSVRAIGTGRTFQWRKDGVNLAGATDSNYVIGNALASSEGVYDCVVSGLCTPAAVSQPCTLYVPTRPRIITEPADQAVCPGTNVQLSLVAQGNNVGYQWYKNGVLIPGATTATLTLPNYNYSMDGRYYCVARASVPNPNNCQIQVQSRTAMVTGLRPPTVATQPGSTDACVGSTLTLVAAGDGFDLQYQWYRDGVAIPSGTQNALTINTVSPSDAGKYTATITGACGLTAMTDTATVTVIRKPTFTQQPVDQNVTVGQPITLTVAGTDIRSIEWYRNSQRINGQTSATLEIPVSKMSDAGVYNAIVRNGCGGAISGYARVNVKDPSLDRPELTLGATSIEFGEIPIGYERAITASALIQNTGAAPMTVESVTSTSTEFTITTGNGTPFTLAPNESSSVTVLARPSAIGSVSGALQVTTNAPNPNGVVLLGATSVLRYTHPSTIDFGEVEASKSKELCATINNTSSVDITIEAASFTGAAAASFSTVTALPMTIAAGTSKEVCITFAPADAGSKNANVNVTSSTGGNSSFSLVGVGTPTVSVNDNDLVNGFSVFPNPTGGPVIVRSKQQIRSITVVNAAGQSVATVDGTNATTEIRWNGAMQSGEIAPSGIYTIIVRAENGTTTIPVAIVR